MTEAFTLDVQPGLALVHGTRACNRCKIEKPLTLENFRPASRKNNSNLGHEWICVACERALHVGETRRCMRCEEVLPIEQFPFRSDHQGLAVRARRSMCRRCTNVRAGELRKGTHIPSREVQKKLPKYEVLKRDLLERGLTYEQIAKKYKCNKRSVYGTIRNRATFRGEWPLLTPADQQRRAQRRYREVMGIGGGRRIDATWLVEELREHLQATVPWVFMDKAERTKTQLNKMRPLLPSLSSWGAGQGFSSGYIPALFRAERPTMDVLHAIKVMWIVGEPVPAWMLKEAKAMKAAPRVLPELFMKPGR